MRSDLGYILHVHVSHAPFHISASPPGHKDTPGQQLFGQYVGLEVIQCLQCSLTDVLREGEGGGGGGRGRRDGEEGWGGGRGVGRGVRVTSL